MTRYFGKEKNKLSNYWKEDKIVDAHQEEEQQEKVDDKKLTRKNKKKVDDKKLTK